jgi:hypothetical protein
MGDEITSSLFLIEGIFVVCGILGIKRSLAERKNFLAESIGVGDGLDILKDIRNAIVMNKIWDFASI